MRKHGIEHWIQAGSKHQETIDQWCTRLQCRNDGQVIPCGIWGDSATYNTRDSLVVLLVNVLSSPDDTRWWTCAFSKRALCACGCSGRCTFDACYKVLSWSFQQLVVQSFPSSRHDGLPFQGSGLLGDLKRERRAGSALACRAAVVQARGCQTTEDSPTHKRQAYTARITTI